MILITASLYNRTDERADAVTPLPMMAATSANFGRVGAAALMMAMRNCLSAASSQTILFPSESPEGMVACVTFWVGGQAGRLWCALKFSCGGDLKSRARACVCLRGEKSMEAGGREDERRSKVKGERVPRRGVTYLRALGVAPSPKTLATSTMFGTEGEATSSMAIKSFLSALSVQVILLPTACPIGMMGDVMCVVAALIEKCLFALWKEKKDLE